MLSMVLKRSGVLVLMLSLAVCGFSQVWQRVPSALHQEVPLASSLKENAERFIVPNRRMGYAMYRPASAAAQAAKRVGTSPAYPTALRVSKAVAPYISKRTMVRLVNAKILERSFPGYEIDFPSLWEKREESVHVNPIGWWQIILEEVYGKEPMFWGAFVPSFALLQEQWRISMAKTYTAEEALQQAYAQAKKIKSGFFVIGIKENEDHYSDVLVLDVRNGRIISILQSVIDVRSQKEAPEEPFSRDPAGYPTRLIEM